MLNLAFDPQKLATVLCLGAHCDDIEIGCGGTLMTLAERYPRAQFHWLVFASDEQREGETRAAAARIFAGGTRYQVDVLRFKGSYLPYQGAEVKDALEAARARLPAPDLVFTHTLQDWHQDHRLIGELTWNTYRNHCVLEYEIPKYEGDLGHPNLFVPFGNDIVERKLLWHGTNVAVVAAIIGSGLRIMPHSGGRVGRGIYMASENGKSVWYVGWAGRTGVMFLGEAALGREHTITRDNSSLRCAPKGCDCIVARGQTDQPGHLGGHVGRDAEAPQQPFGELGAVPLVGVAEGPGVVDRVVHPGGEAHPVGVAGQIGVAVHHVQDGGQMGHVVVVALRLGPASDQIPRGGVEVGVGRGGAGGARGRSETFGQRCHVRILARRLRS